MPTRALAWAIFIAAAVIVAGLCVAILRPFAHVIAWAATLAIVCDPLQQNSFEMIRALVERLPVMVCPSWVDTLTQPIASDDMLAYPEAALAANPAVACDGAARRGKSEELRAGRSRRPPQAAPGRAALGLR
jgi:hypothetical protein